MRRTRTPNLRIHAQCSNPIELSWLDICCPMFLNTGSGVRHCSEVKSTFETLTVRWQQHTFSRMNGCSWENLASFLYKNLSPPDEEQGLTLRRARMPGACRSCPRAHKLFWLRARLGNWFLQSGHVVIFLAVYISLTRLVQILAGHVKISAGHVHFLTTCPMGM